MSIIQLRSTEISQYEVADYVAALALGLLAGLSTPTALVFALILIVAVLVIADIRGCSGATGSRPSCGQRTALLTGSTAKYLVPVRQLSHILAALPGTTRVLPIDDRRRFGYRSVYLDTADLLAYRLTALRRRRRFKIRTRSYLDGGLHSLEVKTCGPRDTTVKQRVPYEGDGETLTDQDRSEVYAALAASGTRTPATADDLPPTSITRYRRTTLFLPASRGDRDLHQVEGRAGRRGLRRGHDLG